MTSNFDKQICFCLCQPSELKCVFFWLIKVSFNDHPLNIRYDARHFTYVIPKSENNHAKWGLLSHFKDKKLYLERLNYFPQVTQSTNVRTGTLNNL